MPAIVMMVIAPIATVLCSVAAAAACCWVLWHVFAMVRHPEWVALVIAVIVILAVSGRLPRSDMLILTVIFLLASAIPIWIEGRAWRHRLLAHAEPRIK